MRWFQINHRHDGLKAKVWAESTPDSPETGESGVVGYISCPEEGALPLLKTRDYTHHFAEWYSVELITRE